MLCVSYWLDHGSLSQDASSSCPLPNHWWFLTLGALRWSQLTASLRSGFNWPLCKMASNQAISPGDTAVTLSFSTLRSVSSVCLWVPIFPPDLSWVLATCLPPSFLPQIVIFHCLEQVDLLFLTAPLSSQKSFVLFFLNHLRMNYKYHASLFSTYKNVCIY